MRPLSPRSVRALTTFDGVVAPARDAATVVLLRQSASGSEVFLLRRQPTMAFASGMHVFPGGGTQASDQEPTPWIGPPPEMWAEAFRCPVPLARALVIAAVRETFEETGVLLAGPDADTVTGTPADAGHLRTALERHEVSLAEVLIDRGLHVRSDLLAPWAHWITPEFEPRRFDTRFFVAVLPDGQTIGHTAGEADAADWHLLSDVIAGARAGRLAMMAPTLHVCRQLDGVDLAGLLGASWNRRIPTVAPNVVDVGGQPFLDAPSAEEF
jgi:8-oxo-dGTP pyrophosphatase MutT (NUDIX family)